MAAVLQAAERHPPRWRRTAASGPLAQEESRGSRASEQSGAPYSIATRLVSQELSGLSKLGCCLKVTAGARGTRSHECAQWCQRVDAGSWRRRSDAEGRKRRAAGAL